MDVYLLLLYVTKEQEHAIELMFGEKQWLFCKSAVQQENQISVFATSMIPDEPVHQRSLIWIHVGRKHNINDIVADIIIEAEDDIRCSAHLHSPKKTVVQYTSLDDSRPKIHTVSDFSDDNIYRTHHGVLPVSNTLNAIQPEEGQSVTSCLASSVQENSGFKDCTVKLERIPTTEKKQGKTSNLRKRGRPKSIHCDSRKKSKLEVSTSKDKNAVDFKNGVKSVKESEIQKDDRNMFNGKDEVSLDFGLNTVTGEVPVNKDNKPDDEDRHSFDDYNDNDGDDDDDYIPSEDEVNEPEAEGKKEETDPDYHYGDRIGKLPKKKRCQIKKRNLDGNSGRGSYTCEVCKKTYKFKRNYVTHFKNGVCTGPVKRIRKKDENAGYGSYYCQVCKTVYAYKRKYLAHFEDGRCNRQCKYCDKVFTRNTVRKHVFYKHELNVERFSCKSCKRRFYEKNELTIHMHFHDTARSFVCDYCGKAFFMYNNLYIHLRKHRHEEDSKRPHCSICNKYFTDINYLEFHKKVTHMKVRNCVCEICGKKFKTERCVKSHMRTHSDERPFKCDVCGKFYKYTHQLSSHKKMFHSKLKRFFCKVCNKGFYFEGKLKDHMNIHSGVRPHHCQVCDYSGCTVNQLAIHKRKHRKPKVVVEQLEHGAELDDIAPKNCTVLSD